MLAAGAAGAVAVMLILVALWFAGLLPTGYVASTNTNAQVPADSKALDALSERVSKIEAAVAKLPAGDAGMAERLTAADNAMKSLGVALTALRSRTDDAAANAGQARERADAAVKAVADLRASMQEAAKNSAGISPAELDALQKRIAELEQSAKAGAR